jgi:hypothetical protein
MDVLSCHDLGGWRTCGVPVGRFIVISFMFPSINQVIHYYVVVNEKDGIYHIEISGNIAATEKHVRQVLTDYEHTYRLSDSILESKILKTSVNGKVQIQSLVLCCNKVFCREVTRVDEVSVLKSGDLQGVIIPEKSDFISGISIWKIAPIDSGSRITYIASIEPGFFIPPILGTKILLSNMRKELKVMFCRIERIARINEARENDKNYAFSTSASGTNNEPCTSN